MSYIEIVFEMLNLLAFCENFLFIYYIQILYRSFHISNNEQQ